MIRQNAGSKFSRSSNAEYTRSVALADMASKVLKRVFDMLVALFGLMVLSPLFVYISYHIKRDSPGPIFYRGPRAGRGGQTFQILKFRTMYERPDTYLGSHITCRGDDRITPFGCWLRTTKLNELPQLWNVLVGDMSIVGPRPEDAEIAATWPQDARQEILSVRTGITSPASVLYHDEEDQLSASDTMNDYFKRILPDKMRLDRLYVRNHSFFGDLDIIFWTIAILLPRMVHSRIPEGYLFAGPFSRFVDRHLTWFLLDIFVAFGAVATAVLLWRAQEPLHWGMGNLVLLSFFLALMFSGVNALVGLNRIVWSEALAEDAGGLVLTAAFATIATLGLNSLQPMYNWLPYPALPTTMIFTIGLMASIGFIAMRYRWRLVTGFASRWLTWRNVEGLAERVLIVGSGDGSQLGSWLLRHGYGSPLLSIVGIVDHELPAWQGMRVNGNQLLGGLSDIPGIIQHHEVGVVLFAIPNAPTEVQEQVSGLCKQSNVRMIYLSDLLSRLQEQLTQPCGHAETH